MSTSAIPISAPSLPNVLPVQQERDIAAISNGASFTEAAAEAGIHRNTITCWRRTSDRFRESLAQAEYDHAMLHREHAEALAELALNTIREILIDLKAWPSVRLKAALAILQTVSTPPPQPPEPLCNPHPLPKLHKNAQSAAKAGRNETCPCGSGLKFKRCCLNKSSQTNAIRGPGASSEGR